MIGTISGENQVRNENEGTNRSKRNKTSASYDDLLYIILNRLNLHFGKSFGIALEKHLRSHARASLSLALSDPEMFRRTLRKTVSPENADKIEREIAHAIWSNSNLISLA